MVGSDPALCLEVLVILRMPVARGVHMRKARHETIERGEDAIAFCDRERTAGEEIVLRVDDDQRVGWLDQHKVVCQTLVRLPSVGGPRVALAGPHGVLYSSPLRTDALVAQW